IFFNGIVNDIPVQRLSLIMLLASFIICFIGIYLKREGVWIVLVALSLILGINILSSYGQRHLLFNYDINLFISFVIVVITFLYLLAQRRRKEKLSYEASLLLSSRLKNELLKKNIQPHFIMNTLTSIMEWVEISPKKSITFIEALADEFEILNQIADLQLIPIQKEIDLCKHHLKIMEFRKEIQYEWIDEGIDLTEQIPPAILHTLVENGITHSKPIDRKIRFHLCFHKGSDYKSYTLKTIALNRKEAIKSKGTGLKYIESRLRESYRANWELISKPFDGGWINTIKIYNS
ncbi:MAG: histidine kinase, partial [Bacteroidota bacterium]